MSAFDARVQGREFNFAVHPASSTHPKEENQNSLVTCPTFSTCLRHVCLVQNYSKFYKADRSVPLPMSSSQGREQEMVCRWRGQATDEPSHIGLDYCSQPEGRRGAMITWHPQAFLKSSAFQRYKFFVLQDGERPSIRLFVSTLRKSFPTGREFRTESIALTRRLTISSPDSMHKK